MTVYQISYDLQSPGQDYDELFDAIRDYGDYAHILESVWLIDTSSTSPSSIRDGLQDHIDSNDRLLVTEKATSGETWATTFSDDYTDWLHNH
ncbi:hypothetical protein C486_16905 [Natrinema gari JCM 14663]|uniref:SinR family protein n=1 Tax=Natrinema gari JCM 14663 TaxID=1230459 RepID=L9YW75_9EURY|nr:hypothetical protein C486_16905 [Natrinema gari JCM 14663]